MRRGGCYHPDIDLVTTTPLRMALATRDRESHEMMERQLIQHAETDAEGYGPDANERGARHREAGGEGRGHFERRRDP